jgi:hypothetical protein
LNIKLRPFSAEEQQGAAALDSEMSFGAINPLESLNELKTDVLAAHELTGTKTIRR